jgi:hypothetical protein
MIYTRIISFATLQLTNYLSRKNNSNNIYIELYLHIKSDTMDNILKNRVHSLLGYHRYSIEFYINGSNTTEAGKFQNNKNVQTLRFLFNLHSRSLDNFLCTRNS